MNRSYTKIRKIQEANMNLEKRMVLTEQDFLDSLKSMWDDKLDSEYPIKIILQSINWDETKKANSNDQNQKSKVSKLQSEYDSEPIRSMRASIMMDIIKLNKTGYRGCNFVATKKGRTDEFTLFYPCAYNKKLIFIESYDNLSIAYNISDKAAEKLIRACGCGNYSQNTDPQSDVNDPNSYV